MALSRFQQRTRSPRRRGNLSAHVTEGQYFKWHGDGPFIRSQEEPRLFTVMVYLNDGFEGGTTDFQFGPSIAPRRGMLLLFEHSLVHQGAPVLQGCKYVLRTDVMFRH